MNSFFDFVDVTHFLVSRVRPRGPGVRDGGSAGGLLMASSPIPTRNSTAESSPRCPSSTPSPRCWMRAFRSPPTSTTNGAIRERECYDYMLSYSPYDNVRRHAYPPCSSHGCGQPGPVLQPAKWVAKLRASRPTTIRCCSMSHGGRPRGKSGRFQRYRETAMIFAFLVISPAPRCCVERKKKAPQAGEASESRAKLKACGTWPSEASSVPSARAREISG